MLDQTENSLEETAYLKIQAMIVNGELSCGMSLSERGLSESLGIGRTPIRAAIRSLARAGFVQSLPRKGTFVRQLSIYDLHEIHEVRLGYELIAAFLAAGNGPTDELHKAADALKALLEADPPDLHQEQIVGWQFHDEIFRATQNKRLCSLYSDLRAQSGLALKPILRNDFECVRRGTLEHLQIFSAIEAQNPDKAKELAWQHVLYGLHDRLKLFAQPPTPITE
jgi:DNA-binding GntR family transcriptional regulator